METKRTASFHPVGVTFETIDFLAKTDSDALALYMSYAAITQWQGTYRVKATTSFMRERLKWGEIKFRSAKKILVENNLVEDVRAIDESGRVVGYYIEVRHIISQPLEKPDPGFAQPLAEQDTSAYQLSDKVLSTINKGDFSEKPKTPRGWTNLRRQEQGKVPLKTPRTTKQEETFAALKFKDYFREQGYQQHGMQFFKVESKKREGAVSKLIINAYKSIGDLKPLIDWWLEGAGEWAEYEPEQCLSAKSIEKFLNKDKIKSKPVKKQKFIDLSEGGDEE